MANMNDFEVLDKELAGSVNLDELESKLYDDLDENLTNDIKELSMLKENKELIGNPKALGNVVKNVIWEQFQNQIGVQAGEKFIEENRGLTLDLRNEAHIQTTENFKEGKIATHNDKIDYQKRYDDWQSNFQKDEDGNIKMHETRMGKKEETLVKGARTPFDKNRPSGSKKDGKDIDHTISAGEIIRDPEANAHLEKSEQIDFANSDANLNEMDKSLNRSKGDKSMDDWLDNPNSSGQKPKEALGIDDETEKKLREKDAEAREEYKKVKDKGKERSEKTGRQSQREEAFRIGKNTVKAVVMELLGDFLKEVISKLIKWFKSSNKKLKTLIESIKDAIHSFIKSLKRKLINVGSTVGTTIATALVGPVVGMIKKAWLFLKQGWNSLKEAIRYLRSPEAKNKPFDIVMLNVGKIVISALTAGGAIILGEVIEKGLMSIPVFNIQIPLLGSLANVLGLFLGAIVAGVVGAIALNLIDKIIAKKEKTMLQIKIAAKTDVVLKGQVVKTYETIERACNAVGAVSQKTVDVLQDSYEKERSSLSDLKKQCEKGDFAYRELEAVLGRKHS